MRLYKTSIKKKRKDLEKWTEYLRGLEMPWDGGMDHNLDSILTLNHFTLDITKLLEKYSLEPSSFDSSLGTIGGGNHFAELQEVLEHIKYPT
jgi:release factor H-coupled RctB family protein